MFLLPIPDASPIRARRGTVSVGKWAAVDSAVAALCCSATACVQGCYVQWEDDEDALLHYRRTISKMRAECARIGQVPDGWFCPPYREQCSAFLRRIRPKAEPEPGPVLCIGGTQVGVCWIQHVWAALLDRQPGHLRSRLRHAARDRRTPQGRRHGQGSELLCHALPRSLGQTLVSLESCARPRCESWRTPQGCRSTTKTDSTAFASSASGPVQEFMSRLLRTARGPSRNDRGAGYRRARGLALLHTGSTVRSRVGRNAHEPPAAPGGTGRQGHDRKRVSSSGPRPSPADVRDASTWNRCTVKSGEVTGIGGMHGHDRAIGQSDLGCTVADRCRVRTPRWESSPIRTGAY